MWRALDVVIEKYMPSLNGMCFLLMAWYKRAPMFRRFTPTRSCTGEFTMRK